jgi:hypothetical protein
VDEAGSVDQWGLSEPLITLIDLIALMWDFIKLKAVGNGVLLGVPDALR